MELRSIRDKISEEIRGEDNRGNRCILETKKSTAPTLGCQGRGLRFGVVHLWVERSDVLKSSKGFKKGKKNSIHPVV